MTIFYRYNDRYNDNGHVVIELDEWHSIKETKQGHWCVLGSFNARQAKALLESGTPLKTLRHLHDVKYLCCSSRFAKATIQRAAWHFAFRKRKQITHLQYQLAKAIQARGAIDTLMHAGCYGTHNTAYEIDAGEHDPYGLVKIPSTGPKPRSQSRWCAYVSHRRTKSGHF